MSDYLPEEIIVQILHKLPIKPLVHCMSVCKSWYSLIKDPNFISTHLTLTISSNNTSNNHLLIFHFFSENSDHCYLHFDNQQLASYMRFDSAFSHLPYLRVIGTFNGIICLVNDLSYCTPSFILWNPLIKKALTPPRPSVTFWTHGHCESFTGFGFDSKTNDYKVLRIVNLISYDGEEVSNFVAELYSLNTNSWKGMTCFAPKYEFNNPDMQAFVNGVVHWIVSKRMGHLGYRNLVLGFDMADEVFHEIILPDSLAGVNPMNIYVRKYGDSSIAIITNDSSLPLQCHIWVMKEYGVVGSWTKLLSLEEPGVGAPMVLGFRISGEVLLKMCYGQIFSCDPQSEGIKMQMYHRQIVSCGPHSEGVKDLEVEEQASCSFVDGYVESLVLLDNANVVSDACVVNDANASNDAYEVSDAIEDESVDTMGAIDAMVDVLYEIDATDYSSHASNDTSDDEIDASDVSDAFSE